MSTGKKKKHFFSQYIAEFFGTYFLVFFGCGAMILSQEGNTDLSIMVPLIFGGVVSVMIYSVGHISGAHFNPAVTIGFWAINRFPGFRVVGYIISQSFGAIFASLTHLFIWGSGHSFGVTELRVSLGIGVFVEVLLSFILMFVIVSVATDSRAKGELAGIAIGSTVALCAFVGGPLTSASMNPSRSLGPALISGQFEHLWVYLLAPLIGTVCGAKIYEWIRCEEKDNQDMHGCC